MDILLNQSKCFLKSATALIINQRFKGGVVRRIRGLPRPTPPGKLTPLPSKYKFKVDFPEEYTIEPLKLTKLGGRDPETGRVVVRTLGGGQKYGYRWVDHFRRAPPGQVLVERVEFIRQDPVRSAHIALVGSGTKRRWIVATSNMKPGDLIETTSDIPKVAVHGKEGNAYPLGALAVGSKVCSIEVIPGSGAKFCNSAATFATIVRKLLTNQVVVALPSKKELILDPKCMAVVGQVSNLTQGTTPVGSPQMMRWLGHRPRSGLWHRKDGYCGRKIHKPLPPQEPRLSEKPQEVLKLHMFPYDFKYKKRFPRNIREPVVSEWEQANSATLTQ